MKINIFLAALGIILGLFGQVGVPVYQKHGATNAQASYIAFGTSVAFAGPAVRAARRTARRTTYAVATRTSIAACAVRAPYWYCDGAYYRKQVIEGKTVYVVVNP